ncbi:uncharacterized protein LOC125833286 [Solanum verrucosum]|uniref:uncharacterized protein LOC125833286 n=1 Tax=Solanum verrucosum TaxID=315347 RepID=UPI0020D0BE63|nr:uncharacterized protein LOC125833286 [Solanum verrucosum]
MGLFVSGLSRLSIKEGKSAMLIGDMDIARLMIHVQQVEEDKLKYKEEFHYKRAKTTGNQATGPAPSLASGTTPKNRGEFRNQNSQNFRAQPTQSQGIVAQRANLTLTCAEYGRNHVGACHDGSTRYFKCFQIGHFMRECANNKHGNVNVGNRAQSSLTAPLDRAEPRGATLGTGKGANRIVPIVSELLVVLSNDLPIVPPEREIDFGIDILRDTRPLSITPYRMAPTELKE